MDKVIEFKPSKDILVIERQKDGSFSLERAICENIPKSELQKRLSDLEGEMKRLSNELTKAETFISQCKDGMTETQRKIDAIRKALDTGFAKM